LFFNLEADNVGIVVALFDVVDRNRKALAGRVLGGYGS